MSKKVAIIGSVGIPAKYGGFETLVEYLSIYLSSKFDLTVYCSGNAYPKKLKIYNNTRLRYIPFRANGFQSIPYDIFSILHAFIFSDTLLILGVSGCCILPLVRLVTKKKIIINIDGIEWRRNKWNFFIKKYLKYSEKLAIKYADYIVADNVEIQKYIKQIYFKDSELITYGADHVYSKKMDTATLERYPFLKQNYVFKVCRIEPENNIDIILESFITYDSFQLVIIGNWNFSKYGINLRSKYSKYKNIYLIDPIFDQNILNQIRSNCFIYIHGHSAGGTNPSLVEAMILKLPIIAFDCSFNRATTNNNSMFFENSLDLTNKLKNINSIKLKEISEQMYNYAYQNYRWELIASKYQDLFNK
jgi:glycosyltransferase involved in cell wall biosynthesis